MFKRIDIGRFSFFFTFFCVISIKIDAKGECVDNVRCSLLIKGATHNGKLSISQSNEINFW